ncbi:hypothetical protein [Streptomyces flavidovirens]
MITTLARVEALPTHPRKASAGTRRHHHKYLPYRLAQITPGAVRILIAPLQGDDEQQAFVVLAWRADESRIRPPAGSSSRIAALLQGGFVADWTVPQTWTAAGNQLTEYRPTVPDDLRGWI